MQNSPDFLNCKSDKEERFPFRFLAGLKPDAVLGNIEKLRKDCDYRGIRLPFSGAAVTETFSAPS